MPGRGILQVVHGRDLTTNDRRESSRRLAQDLARAADSKKADDILILDMSTTLGIADFFVICSEIGRAHV